jgi:DNA-binding phage protein
MSPLLRRSVAYGLTRDWPRSLSTRLVMDVPSLWISAQSMVTALGTVARARGMSRVAKRCGLGRESLYKALSDSGNPAFTTIVGVASALGYTFEMRTAPAKRAG